MRTRDKILKRNGNKRYYIHSGNIKLHDVYDMMFLCKKYTHSIMQWYDGC
jgi:hypothetical protein